MNAPYASEPALAHSRRTYLKKPTDYERHQVRTIGQIAAMLWEWSRQIHLQCRCTLIAVSLENLLLIKRSISYFDQKYTSFSFCLIDMKPLYLYITLTETTQFLLKMSLCCKTYINLVIQSKIWKGHRSNRIVGGTVLPCSVFGALAFVGFFDSTLFASCTWRASRM